ncbi:MAG: polymer-forming cytoskeletal protein [Spirochaetaceae bacterium]|jgi:cytoskeletal protein CcmA (bactofilin family)|nr:polymer-forming cytoskeletal protein [Spirochaetaceae bacterium]
MIDVHSEALDAEDFDTVITADIDFSGSLSFEKPLLIRGKVTGSVDSSGLLVIDEGAVVEAGISAARVVIRGTVRGDISAMERVEISATGKLYGDITAPAGGFFMESGCVFNGRCIMREKDERTDAE